MSQFRIEETLSESGSTSVFRAYQETLDRRVLLKVLHRHLANDPIVRERFTREAHACAHLRSEHIVQIYDLTEYNGCPAIVMEFVHGQSLKEVIRTSAYDRDELARRTAVSILRALAVAHHRGIVHRDIKPGNILVAEDGTVKLTDFGLAHITDSPTMTLQGSVLGTPAYMAPEQIRGETVDGRTDLFALGATLLEVSTGKRIFAGENYSECVQKVSAFKTEQLDQFSEQLPVNFLAFLKRLMEPVPDDRFRSAKEALEALHERIEERGTVQIKKSFSSIRLAFGISAAVILLSILVYSVAGRRSSDTSSLAVGEQKHTSETRTTQDSIGQPMQDRARQSDLAEEHQVPLRKGTPRHDTEFGKSGTTLDSGDVRFTSNPWAKVYVDGRFVGETPISQSMHLSKGKHVVTFSNPSFDPIVKTIEVHGENEGHISADFLENAGYLQCAVEPWAEVYIDEQYKDTTPLNKPIVCSAGKHTVRFHNNAFRDVIQEVSIKARDTLMITSSLPTLH